MRRLCLWTSHKREKVGVSAGIYTSSQRAVSVWWRCSVATHAGCACIQSWMSYRTSLYCTCSALRHVAGWLANAVCCTLSDACVGPTRWVCRRFSSNVEDGASQSLQVYCVSLNSFTLYVYMTSQDFPTFVGRIPHPWTRTRELWIYCVSVSGLSWCHLHQV